MPWVKRERIKVRRDYGDKPVLERTKYYKEKKPKVKTPRMDEAIQEYRHKEQMKRMELKIAKAKAREKRKREWDRKMRELKKVSGAYSDVFGTGRKRRVQQPQRKTRYIIKEGIAYPVKRPMKKEKKKKKKKDDWSWGGMQKEYDEMMKDFGW